MRGYRAVTDAFARYESEPIRGFVIWLPMLRLDTEAAARARSAECADPRIRFSWDRERRAGRAFARPLGLRALNVIRTTAWDVYLVYAPGVRWTGDDPPPPTHWEHQLSRLQGAPPDHELEPARLAEAVGLALRGVHAPTLW